MKTEHIQEEDGSRSLMLVFKEHDDEDRLMQSLLLFILGRRDLARVFRYIPPEADSPHRGCFTITVKDKVVKAMVGTLGTYEQAVGALGFVFIDAQAAG